MRWCGYRGLMMTLAEVERVASGLPEVTEGTRFNNRTWFVAGKAFAWERPFSKADIKRFGDAPVPPLPILAVRTADLDEKESVLSENRPGFFTIPHFDGFAAVLIELGAAEDADVVDAIRDAWFAVAPPTLRDSTDLA